MFPMSRRPHVSRHFQCKVERDSSLCKMFRVNYSLLEESNVYLRERHYSSIEISNLCGSFYNEYLSRIG